MEDRSEEHFTIENRISELPALAERVEELAERWELQPTVTMNINLVLEEALSNIIYYAYPDDGEHEIQISLSLEGQNLCIIITDDGIAFDPTAHQEPDISLSAEERPVGGLGIFLISKIMDSVRYAREQNRNTLTLQKKIVCK